MAKLLKAEGVFSDFMPAKKALHVEEDLRCIAFYLKAGQKINLHTSPHRVITLVLQGEGDFFVGSEEKRERLGKGEALLYEPNEPHGFQAVEDMVVVAIVV
ncbi:MAG: cupin domain-containing protein [Aquificaceae bacterium]|jgi:quercetin dioxygenase-like cupin family protein|uniref:cupin domain-containing protein n=1 Tax=Hydrogenobacter sp. Uz 6-8 TaxID=3384828 RepID=UPI0030AA681C